jgi:DNA-binding MarR family transcriptional regulator/ribosomal protein S18 acetylase RimI-like enzyme
LALEHFSEQFARFAGVASRVQRLVDREMGKAGATRPQQRILCELLRSPASTDGQVAASLGMGSPQVSVVMKSLLCAGTVSEEPSPDHKAQRHLSLTAEGQALAQSINEQITAVLLREIERLVPVERQMMFNAINGINPYLRPPSRDKIEIRTAGVRDISAIIRGAQQQSDELGWDPTFQLDIVATCRKLTDGLRSQEAYGWLAHRGPTMVGAVLMSTQHGLTSFSTLDDRPHIAFVYVRPDCRNKGLGAKLLNECILEAAKLEEEVVAAEVPTALKSATKLFESAKFKRMGTQNSGWRYGKLEKWSTFQVKVAKAAGGAKVPAGN